MIKNIKLIILAAVLLTAQISCRDLYDGHHSNVINLNKKNFDTQVTQNRSKNIISVIHFYLMNDGKSRGLKLMYEKLSEDYEGMFKVLALNCEENPELCEKNNVKEFPTFKVFPPNPAPVMNYEGKLEVQGFVNFMSRFVENKATELNLNNHESFLTENPDRPKCILFTDKKQGFPLILKALSINFDKKIDFAIVRSEESSLIKKYKIKTFPKIMIIRVDKKTEFYEGETKYKPLFEFVNVYSETFHRVGEDKTPRDNAPEKPWLKEKFPELNHASSNDLCFKKEGVICVVLLNEQKPQKNLEDLFYELQDFLSPKINRGIKYKFMWYDISNKNEFTKHLGLENNQSKMMILNPGKRKRYFIMEDVLQMDNIKNVFDKLASGDIRFKNFKGNTLPSME